MQKRERAINYYLIKKESKLKSKFNLDSSLYITFINSTRRAFGRYRMCRLELLEQAR